MKKTILSSIIERRSAPLSGVCKTNIHKNVEKRSFSSIIVLFAALLLLLVSCSSGKAGLLYTMSNLQRVDDTKNLPNDITIMAVDNTTSYTYITAGKVYRKNFTTTSEWNAVDAPTISGATDKNPALASSLAVFKGSLYASFYLSDLNASGYGLYKGAESSTGVNWTQVTDNNFTDSNGTNKQIGTLFSVIKPNDANGSILFTLIKESTLNSQNETLFSLYYSNDGSTSSFEKVTFPEDNMTSDTLVIDVVHDGSALWILTPKALYTASAANAAFTTSTITADGNSSNIYGGLFYDSNSSKLLVSSLDGRLFARNSSGIWSTSSQEVPSGSSAAAKLREIIRFNTTLYIAADIYGFATLGTSVLSTDLNNTVTPTVSSDLANSNFGDLTSKGYILDFHSVTENNSTVLYAGTKGQGLWKYTTTWNRE